MSKNAIGLVGALGHGRLFDHVTQYSTCMYISDAKISPNIVVPLRIINYKSSVLTVLCAVTQICASTDDSA